MKILYVYEKMPGVYQNYLRVLLNNIKGYCAIKTLVYKKSLGSDYFVRSYGTKDLLQRYCFILRFVKSKSLDIKIMKNFDIVHIQHSYLWPKIIHLKNMKITPKIVITLRGGDTYMKPWISNSWREFYNDYGKNIDAFITMSNHQKNYLTRWGVDKNKVHVIPISFGHFSDVKPKYPNEMLKLVSAYRMTWEKNIEGTLQFAKKLKDKNISFIFDIYGDGNDFCELYYLVDRLELSSYVNIMGKVENEELKSKMINYDFFVQLSISEALPTTVLEAQSNGVPCIVSNSDGLKEAVVKNHTGIVGEYNEIEYFANECIRIFNDKELYYSFSESSINYVNLNFSVENETERLIKLYESL